MALQPVFKRGYIDYLKNNIKPEAYLGDHFEYDQSQVVRLYGVPHPDGLLERLDPTPDGDLQSAIAIYEAYPDLSPLFAQQDDLWVYLTHVDLFEYVKKRWPIKASKDIGLANQCDFIEDHWFRHSKHLFRTSIGGLWWQVKLTMDETRDNPFELTGVYFKCGQDFHQRFGELSLIRHKEAMVGVLEFLKNHDYLIEKGFDPKGQFISRLFNNIGGTKLLSSLPREYFTEVLEKKLSIIENISGRDDVQNKEINI